MATVITGEWIVLEVPHRGEPVSYSGFDQSDYLSATHRAAENSDGVVFERTTARELAENHYGLTADHSAQAFEGEGATSVYELGVKHGWDRPLYRADWLEDPGKYVTHAVDEVDAAVAYNGHDLSYYSLITTPDECREMLEYLEGDRAPRIGQCGPVRAASVLQQRAILLGWIA
jgi:hypothetical protein